MVSGVSMGSFRFLDFVPLPASRLFGAFLRTAVTASHTVTPLAEAWANPHTPSEMQAHNSYCDHPYFYRDHPPPQHPHNNTVLPAALKFPHFPYKTALGRCRCRDKAPWYRQSKASVITLGRRQSNSPSTQIVVTARRLQTGWAVRIGGDLD